jgi:hypothetical protein
VRVRVGVEARVRVESESESRSRSESESRALQSSKRLFNRHHNVPNLERAPCGIYKCQVSHAIDWV